MRVPKQRVKVSATSMGDTPSWEQVMSSICIPSGIGSSHEHMQNLCNHASGCVSAENGNLFLFSICIYSIRSLSILSAVKAFRACCELIEHMVADSSDWRLVGIYLSYRLSILPNAPIAPPVGVACPPTEFNLWILKSE